MLLFDEAPSESSGGAGGPERSGPRCPVCQRPVSDQHRPFCSKRCADIDLHRWLAGIYRVPTKDPPKEGEDKPEDS